MLGINSVWCYPIACCVIQCLQTGTYKCMALLFVASKEWYSTTREEASFPYVLRSLVEHFSGPFVGFLGCKFKISHVILAGCLVSSVSIGTCFFAKNIYVLSVLWGVMFGLGCGISRHLQPVFLSKHFKENLTQANGIAFLGASIGGIVIPAIFEVLLLNYGLSGSFLVYSAISLNTIPAAMILFTNKSSSGNISVINVPVEEDILFVKEVSIRACKDTVKKENTPELNDDLHTSTESLLEYVHFPESNLGTQQETSPGKTFLKTGIENTYKSKDLKDWTGISNFQNESEVKNNQKSSALSPNKGKTSKLLKIFIIFCDPLFQLIALTQSIYFYTLSIYLLIITDYARDIGIHVDVTVYILITFGAGDIVSRAGLGWVTDKGYLSAINFSALCSFCFGISLSSITFTSNFSAILVLTFFVGVAIGTQMLVQPGIINMFFKGEKKTMAMASRTFYTAPISLTIPGLIGYFRDTLGSYVWLIHFCSITSIVCGLICLSFPCLYRSRCRNKFSG